MSKTAVSPNTQEFCKTFANVFDKHAGSIARLELDWDTLVTITPRYGRIQEIVPFLVVEMKW